MGFLRKIKNVLPVSSRSFHSFRTAEEERLNLLLQEIRQQQDFNKVSYEALARAVDSLSNDLDAHDTHIKMFAWENYRKSNETLIDAKKRFFKELPSTTGSSRLIQIGCTKLLSEFNSVCASSGLSYWAGGGTLIGAIRHNGFIPWDDDVDLCMLRRDISKLKTELASSDEFKLSIVFDPFVICCQYRFMFLDEDIPCFLDIFPFDYVYDFKSRSALDSLRNKLMNDLASKDYYPEWLKRGCIEEDDPIASQVKQIFMEYLQKATDDHLINIQGEESCIVRGIDNFDDPNGYHWSSKTNEVFPLEWVKFENTEIAIPKNYNELLEGAYGDIYSLPKDINTHFDHIAGAVDDQTETDKALKIKLGLLK